MVFSPPQGEKDTIGISEEECQFALERETLIVQGLPLQTGILLLVSVVLALLLKDPI